MCGPSFFIRSLLLTATFFLFSATHSKTFGQSGFYGGELAHNMEIMNNVDYKWAVTQMWDKVTEEWKDTLAVSYSTPGANGKPAEVFTRSYDSLIGDTRGVISYDGQKITSSITYMKDPLSGEFRKEPYSSIQNWYSGDCLVKNEMAFDFSIIEVFGNATYHSQTGYRLENQKIIADSTFFKFSAITEELSGLGYSSEDTAWTLFSRNEYLYIGNSIVTLNYTVDKETSSFVTSGKDSTVITDDKVTEIHSFSNAEGEWITTAILKLLYDGNRITQSIYQSRVFDVSYEMVNMERTQYFHTPYPFSGIRHLSSSQKTNRINAFVSEKNGLCAVNISLNRSSDFSIYLTDLKGRKLGNDVRRRVMPGSSSLPLSVSTPGKYLCHIVGEQERAVVPFTKIK